MVHEGDGILLHRCRLSLWGKVSVREFKANLSTRSGRVMIVDDQSWGALLSSRMGWFCFARPVLWANRALVSASSTLDLARSPTCFEEAPGSSCMAATTIWYGLKDGHTWFASLLISWVAIALTTGSREQV